jgi:hypothetical protein
MDSYDIEVVVTLGGYRTVVAVEALNAGLHYSAKDFKHPRGLYFSLKCLLRLFFFAWLLD